MKKEEYKAPQIEVVRMEMYKATLQNMSGTGEWGQWHSIVIDGLQAPVMNIAREERVLANTMSVDAYFDVLILQVRKDYAATTR